MWGYAIEAVNMDWQKTLGCDEQPCTASQCVHTTLVTHDATPSNA
jgi:hypothetical protein